MYLHNKYTTWYNNIITNAQVRVIDGYTEKHHIIPKSFGGSNKKDNLVSLTAREHFICHLLLTKMTHGKQQQQMIHSAHFLMTNHKIQSRTYEMVKRMKSELLKIDNPMKDPAAAKRLGDAIRGEKHHMKRAECRARAVELNSGSNNPNFGKKQKRVVCEVCGKDLPINSYARWHGKNCRFGKNKSAVLVALA